MAYRHNMCVYKTNKEPVRRGPKEEIPLPGVFRVFLWVSGKVFQVSGTQGTFSDHDLRLFWCSRFPCNIQEAVFHLVDHCTGCRLKTVFTALDDRCNF